MTDENTAAVCEVVQLKTVDDVRQWFAQLRLEKDKEGKPQYKEKQLEMIGKVVDRVCEEMTDAVQLSDPLLWCMHGGPGVGKSYVLKAIRDLFKLLGYQNNVHYLMTALQAVRRVAGGGYAPPLSWTSSPAVSKATGIGGRPLEASARGRESSGAL